MLDFLKEFWAFLKVRKKYWLFPVLFALLVLGVLIFTTSSTAVAPFVYTIF